MTTTVNPGGVKRKFGIGSGVAVGLLVVAFLDHAYGSQLPMSHLYYLPILVAAVAFGYVGGLAAAGASVALFALIHLSFTGEVAGLEEADVLRLIGFILVAIVTARLVADRTRLHRLSTELAASNAELACLNDRLTEVSGTREPIQGTLRSSSADPQRRVGHYG